MASESVNLTRTVTSMGASRENDTQYINHSCEPNANAFSIDGFIIIFALRDTLPGEEITVDYLNSFAEDQSV
jgi:SET domain-containing protein